MSYLFDDIRYYAPYAFKALLLQSCVVAATAFLFYKGGLLNGIPWSDAVILPFYLVLFLALSVPSYVVIKMHPDGPESGAFVLRIALLVAAAAMWAAINNPVLGWCAWLALAPSAWQTIDYKRLLRAGEKRANRSPYEKAMDEVMGR